MVRLLGTPVLAVLVFFFVCFTPGCRSAVLMYDSYYIALNYDALDTLEGAPYAPPKNQYITINNLVLPDELTFEFYFFWLGSGGGLGAPFQPIFFAGNTQTYMLVTPKINPDTDGTINPGIQFVVNGGSPIDIALDGYLDNRWIHFVIGIRPTTAGESYALVSSWDDVGLQWVEGNVVTFNTPVLGTGIPAGPAHFGDVPARTGTPITVPFAGKLDEARIWSVYKDVATVRTTRNTSFKGNEANLIAYWKFDEASGLAIQDSSPSGFTGTLAGTDAALIQRMRMSTPAEGIIAEPPSKFTPFSTLVRGTTGTTPVTDQFTSSLDESAGDYTIVIDSFPASGQFCVLAGCTGTSTSPVASATPFDRAFTVTYTPDRGSCGVDSTATFHVEDGPSTNTVNYVVNVPPLTTQFTDTTQRVIDTRGDSIVLSASDLGIVGPFAANEDVRVVLINGDSITCTSPVVASGQITCDMPAGIGAGTVNATVCGRHVTLPDGFSYQAPTISNIVVANATVLTITGDFFGPTRTTFDPIYETVALIRNTIRTPCNITSVTDHTELVCEVETPLTDKATYTVEVSLVGPTGEEDFTFELCNPECENNGRCVGLNTCNCDGTGYEGDTCQTALVCTPVCENGGVCIRNPDDSLECSCPSEFTGPSCSEPVEDTTDGPDNSATTMISSSTFVLALFGFIVNLFF